MPKAILNGFCMLLERSEQQHSPRMRREIKDKSIASMIVPVLQSKHTVITRIHRRKGT